MYLDLGLDFRSCRSPLEVVDHQNCEADIGLVLVTLLADRTFEAGMTEGLVVVDNLLGTDLDAEVLLDNRQPMVDQLT